LSTPAHLVSGSTYMLGVGHLDLSTSLPPFGWDYTLGNKYTPGASVDGFLSADADYVFSTFATTPSGIVDSIPPVITVPSDQTVSATSTSGAIVTYTTPTATDNVDGPITPTCDHNSGDAFPIGTTTVTCTATDSAGNHSTKSFSVIITTDMIDQSNPGPGTSYLLLDSAGTIIGTQSFIPSSSILSSLQLELTNPTASPIRIDLGIGMQPLPSL